MPESMVSMVSNTTSNVTASTQRPRRATSTSEYRAGDAKRTPRVVLGTASKPTAATVHTESTLNRSEAAVPEKSSPTVWQPSCATLRDGTATWTFDEEREHTGRYLELLQARFGERLAVDWQQDPGVGWAQVPRFAIQSLLENAVKHNASRVGALRVRISVELHGDTVQAVVEDDGQGFRDGETPQGNGLARLERTLRLIHPTAARLERETRASGGARVRFTLPRTAR